MATETYCATASRRPTSIARPAPRVIGNRTSMALAAAQPTERYAASGYTGEALRIFDKVPGWAVAHAMRDNSMFPLILEGEVVVVESDGKPGWLPQEGSLYLIQYASPPGPFEAYGRTKYDVVLPRLVGGKWWAGPLRSQMGRQFFMSDGPYPDECALANKLIGRVVGIYNPGALAMGGAL